MGYLFEGSLLPRGSDLRQSGRNGTADSMDSFLADGDVQSVMFCTPRGTGKSTFLNWYFSPARVRGFAAEQRLLIKKLILFDRHVRTEAGIFVRLTEAVEDSLELLPAALEPEMRRKLQQAREEAQDDPDSAKKAEAVLRAVTGALRREGYRVALVIEDFHMLYREDQASQDNLEKLASIAQSGLLAYIAAADYYPLTESACVHVSNWMRIFALLEMPGLPFKRVSPCVRELIAAARERLSEGAFDEDEEAELDGASVGEAELKALWKLTGGVPELLRRGLNSLYAYSCAHPAAPPAPEALPELLLPSCGPLFEGWLSRLSEKHRETLRVILRSGTDAALRALPRGTDKSMELRDMGLAKYSDREQRWKLICPLFGAWLETELERPQAAEPSDYAAPQPGAWQTPVWQPFPGLGGGSVTINGNVFTAPVTVNQNVFQTIEPSSLLRQLREGGTAGLGRYLLEQVSAWKGLPEHAAGDASGGGEAQCEEAVARRSEELIGDVALDEEQELELSRQELDTLDASFREARRDFRTELTDELLGALSQQCRFYLKLSVVVEKALQFIKGYEDTDCSPQMVLYGKAFEQALHDSLYELFCRDETLANYDMFEHRADPGSKNAFANIPGIRKTTIANYCFLIGDQAGYLAGLCSGDASLPAGCDARWWDRLFHDLNAARLLRNRLHPGSEPPRSEHLDGYIRFLVGGGGQEGILARLGVGRQLTMDLFHRPTLTLLEANRYLAQGTLREAVVERVLNSGAVRARTADTGYLVKLSKKKAAEHLARTGERLCEGAALTVSLLEYASQDGEDFFRADFPA